MSFPCIQCEKQMSTILSGIPLQWRNQIVKLLCSIQENTKTVSCEDIKSCETITSLSPFVREGSNLCITYKNEKGVAVKRCFDIEFIFNNLLSQVDPVCIVDSPTWESWSYLQKLQAVIDISCGGSTTSTTTIPVCTSFILSAGSSDASFSFVDCLTEDYYTTPVTNNTSTQICSRTIPVILTGASSGATVQVVGDCSQNLTTSTTTTSTTTTTTTTTTTSTTTTLAPACKTYKIEGTPDVVGVATYSYDDCDGVPASGSISANQTIYVCAQNGSVSSEQSANVTITDIATGCKFGAYWGWKNTSSILTESEIITQYNGTGVFDINTSIIADYTANSLPKYLWMAEPITESAKTKWDGDGSGTLNQGDIGGTSGTTANLFANPIIVGGFRFYITEYETANTGNPIEFKIS